jgi:hypothetical protein
MKKILFIPIISSLFLFGGLSCSENDELVDATVTFNFELQNKGGEARTTFYEGENIFLSLKVTNTTEEDLSLDPAIHYENIIQLYKITEEGESFLGNFYENGQLTNEYRQTIFEKNTITEIVFPWVWSNNSPFFWDSNLYRIGTCFRIFVIWIIVCIIYWGYLFNFLLISLL